MVILSSEPEFVVPPAAGTRPWQTALRTAVRDAEELLRLLRLTPADLPWTIDSQNRFGLLVPRGFVARMRLGDPHDPLLRQVLATTEERLTAPGDCTDPVGDGCATIVPGLLHKYQGRALLITTGACAIHCRYCFRRHFAYSEAPHTLAAWEGALEKIAADPTIQEVILSGGDPLTLIDERLAQLADRLARIEHVRWLRVHTRLPIVIPERVDDALLDWLCGTRLQPIMVLHANHAAELDDHVAAAIERLVSRGVLLLNQAVLLRGVNVRVETLVDLSQRLVELRVVPYYLHQMDRVAGASHFDVPPADGKRLVRALRARLPGYAVPRYVREIAGQPYKVPLA